GFVTRLNATGSALVFSTYLGGSGEDSPSGIAVDPAGNVYVVGFTSSKDFPVTSGAYQKTFKDTESSAFVSKLNPAGSALIYSSLLGGSVNDEALSVAVDSSGNAYVAGQSWSPDFPSLTSFGEF